MPPTFGGKSLVTRRWGATARPCLPRGFAGSKPGLRPRRVLLEHRVVVAFEVGPDHGRSSRSSLGRRRCRGRRGRCGGGSGPAGGRCTSGRADAGARRRPRSRGARRGRRRLGVRLGRRRRAAADLEAVGRAGVLAGVAAVDPPAERSSVLLGEVALGLEEPGEAASGVEHARLDEGAGGTRREAALAGAAPLGRSVGGRRRERRIGDDRPEHELRTATAVQQQVRVLAVEAESGPSGRLPVDEGVVVGEDPRLPPRPSELTGDHLEGAAEVLVVVDPAVPGDRS